RQLQRWPDRVDPKTEAEQVHLKTFAGGEQDTDEPIKRQLKPGPAGCGGEHTAARQEILADRIRRELDRQVGNLPGDVGEEGIAVGPGPGTVGIGDRDSY